MNCFKVERVACSFTLLLSAASAAPAFDAPDFTNEVRPILSQHCFACHGPNEESRKANLRLVNFEGATHELEPGVRAVSPGDLKNSLLWERINDHNDPMPPQETHKPLSAEQIDILRRWIESGASYAPHWAWVAPKRVAPPTVNAATDPIDSFLQARLASEGLTWVARADPTTVLRRLHLDIAGLPPDIAAVERFANDPSPENYAREVDALLASPHFGERMATPWLDLVRYADTVGYHGDQEHWAWPYRDWVIASFNDNKPFDDFTIEQLAGDLLATPTQETLVGSAYNRLVMTTHEGGAQLKEYRAIYMSDRVRTTSEVWMGATLGCAECHDHKYDPFTAHDFYAFGAFFADVEDEEHLVNQYGGLNTNPTRRLPEMTYLTSEAQAADDRMRNQIEATESQIAEALQRLPMAQAQWESQLKAALATNQTTESLWVDDTLDTGGEVSGTWDFVSKDVFAPATGTHSRKQSSNGLIQHYTRGTTRTIQLKDGDVLKAWVFLSPEQKPRALMLQCFANNSWEHRAVWGDNAITYGHRDKDWVGYNRQGALPKAGEWVELEVPLADIGLKTDDIITGLAFTQFGGTVYWDRTTVASNTIASPAEVAALALAPADRTDAQRAVLIQLQRTQTPQLIALEDELARTVAKRSNATKNQPKVLFTKALKTPRPVRLLPRGNWLDESGELLDPAVPSFLGSIESDQRRTRLDLALWLTKPIPNGVGELTARVFVNRVWAMLFGTGLCPSVEDFGGQGRPPTHLELLDTLALDFVDSGWDIKALVRRLLLTQAYQASSIPTDELQAHDPENLLFARQFRQRLSAEMIRDNALKLSGLLIDRRGGPPAKPPQPTGLYKHLNFPVRKYAPSTNDQQWRRGVYVHRQRQFLHPMLSAFDTPTRERCSAKRSVSNTPTAALVLLNDPCFVESARAMAELLLSADFPDDIARLRAAMQRATGREPLESELAILYNVLEDNRTWFKDNPADAASLVAVGNAVQVPGFDTGERAAWTQVTRTVLNLHETITRE